jgi:hypothetical protein
MHVKKKIEIEYLLIFISIRVFEFTDLPNYVG